MTVSIISGASRGIGKAIKDSLPLDHFVIEINSRNCNLIDYGNVENYVDKFYAQLRDADQINVILCASQIGSAFNTSVKECNDLFKINVLGNFTIIKGIYDYPATKRIVWFAGGGAAFPMPEFFGYSLSKVAVVRAVENLSTMLGKEDSIIALAPGAVDTDMLKTVKDAGVAIRTHTDMSEPVNFVRKFITDEIDSKKYNGFFLHVRDDLSTFDGVKFKLRRTE